MRRAVIFCMTLALLIIAVAPASIVAAAPAKRDSTEQILKRLVGSHAGMA